MKKWLTRLLMPVFFSGSLAQGSAARLESVKATLRQKIKQRENQLQALLFRIEELGKETSALLAGYNDTEGKAAEIRKNNDRLRSQVWDLRDEHSQVISDREKWQKCASEELNKGEKNREKYTREEEDLATLLCTQRLDDRAGDFSFSKVKPGAFNDFEPAKFNRVQVWTVSYQEQKVRPDVSVNWVEPSEWISEKMLATDSLYHADEFKISSMPDYMNRSDDLGKLVEMGLLSPAQWVLFLEIEEPWIPKLEVKRKGSTVLVALSWKLPEKEPT